MANYPLTYDCHARTKWRAFDAALNGWQLFFWISFNLGREWMVNGSYRPVLVESWAIKTIR